MKTLASDGLRTDVSARPLACPPEEVSLLPLRLLVSVSYIGKEAKASKSRTRGAPADTASEVVLDSRRGEALLLGLFPLLSEDRETAGGLADDANLSFDMLTENMSEQQHRQTKRKKGVLSPYAQR